MPPRSWITVVSGLPRSGTSMMMQVLAAGGVEPLTDQLRTADPDNPRGYYEFEPVKKTKEDPSWVAGATGRCVKLVHLLLRDLPDGHEYRVLFMRRNMDEVLASQQKMLDRLGRKGAAVKPEQLAAIFTKQLQQIEAWLTSKPNFSVRYVDYNRMIADPAPEVQAIDAFLGGGMNTEAMVKAVDPGFYRNRR